MSPSESYTICNWSRAAKHVFEMTDLLRSPVRLQNRTFDEHVSQSGQLTVHKSCTSALACCVISEPACGKRSKLQTGNKIKKKTWCSVTLLHLKIKQWLNQNQKRVVSWLAHLKTIVACIINQPSNWFQSQPYSIEIWAGWYFFIR